MHTLTTNTIIFERIDPENGCDPNPCESYETCKDVYLWSSSDAQYECQCANHEEICVEDLNCFDEYDLFGGSGGVEFSDYSIRENGFITAIHIQFETIIELKL